MCRNEDDCNVKACKQVISIRIKCLSSQGMKTTIVSKKEDDCYISERRELLCQGKKTTVISRNEEDCYIKERRRLLCQGMKTTVISTNEEDCYIKE